VPNDDIFLLCHIPVPHYAILIQFVSSNGILVPNASYYAPNWHSVFMWCCLWPQLIMIYGVKVQIHVLCWLCLLTVLRNVDNCSSLSCSIHSISILREHSYDGRYKYVLV